MRLLRTRYCVLFYFLLLFIMLSTITRIILTCLSWKAGAFTFSELCTIYARGTVYDLAVALFISSFYSLYLLITPLRYARSRLNRIFTYSVLFIIIALCLFSFFAEITFWKEFDSRFNFIAVDYLVYTYEVINNISQSYPLPLIISVIILITGGLVLLMKMQGIFTYAFFAPTPARIRSALTSGILLLSVGFMMFLNNDWAERDKNRYANELSKAGIFSFFAAFRNNDLDYDNFYRSNNIRTVFANLKTDLDESSDVINRAPFSIEREIRDTALPSRPNLIMVTIESLSADFLQHFGNTQHLTPVLDSIADRGVLFTDMYATGTRTVRGMEALTLGVPPTPGNSIVRRQHNDDLYSTGSVFKQAGYSNTFFYGGDGYFDNMNAFFGSNGFNITDRGSHIIPAEKLPGTRHNINDAQVHFENAWGIADEDLYDAVIRNADEQYQHHQLFYDFVMTTSNHRPYTYPAGKISTPPGTGREGAVRYTDYAIGQWLNKIKNKPWFDNTVIIFIADHCASSAGKNEINVEHYHIPCIIYNCKNYPARTIDVQCSQIDLYPTLFGMLHWSYPSRFYGKNVLLPEYHERAFVSTYQKLGYLEKDKLVVLSPKQQVDEYRWNKADNSQEAILLDTPLVQKAIGYYESAAYLFKNGLLRRDAGSEDGTAHY